MKQMTIFLKEVLRLYPPGSDNELKVAKSDHTITDGRRKYWIPKGTRIKLGIYGTQINPKWWPDPYEFKPERFLNNEFHPYAWLAFSAGPKVCLGKNFALLIGKLCLIEFLNSFDIEKFEKPKGFV